MWFSYRISAVAVVLCVSVLLVAVNVGMGQVPVNRAGDGSTIPEMNVVRVMEIKGEVSQDATMGSSSGLRLWMSGGIDQPQGIMLWNWLGIDDTECVGSIADVDDDGYPDVLSENYDAGASGNNFTCLSGASQGTGDVIWAVHPQGGPSNSGGYGDQCVNSISDISGDGYHDALLGTAWGARTVFAIDGVTGATLWSYDTYNDPVGSGWIYSVAPIADVDGDSVDDVLAAAGGSCMSAFCFSGVDGTMLWRHGANDAVGTVNSIRDVNGDGVTDALVGAWGNGTDERIFCISGASVGTGVVLWDFNCGGDVQHVSSIPDVNNSGCDDAIAASWSDNVYCLEGSTGLQIWVHGFGSSVSRAEPIPDVNGDGIYDVFVGGWSGTVKMLSGANGQVIWATPLAGGNTWTVYTLGDVDDDGINDVVAGSSVSGGTGGTVYVLSGVDGVIIWDYITNGWVNTVRGMGDVNGDNLDDVIAGNQGGPGPFVWCFEGDTLAGGIPEPPQVLISEFTTLSTQEATIEFYNLGTNEVDVGGWMILQYSPGGVDTATIDSGVTISGEGYQVVDPVNSQGLSPDFEFGMLLLAMRNGYHIDSVGYGGMGGAPAPLIEWSTSLSLVSSGGWAERFTLDPTPTWGYQHDAPIVSLGLSDVLINEVYPLGGEGDAFVELYNSSSSAVDISGWIIAGGTEYVIPAGTVVDPEDYFLLWEDDFPEFFGCAAGGDNIYLLNADTVRVDQMGWWGGVTTDSSWAAIPDGDRTVFDGYDLATSPDFEVSIPTPAGQTGVEPGSGSGKAIEVNTFSLGPAYPNPFNASTRIRYSLDKRCSVRLVIHDILGREVARLVQGDVLAGSHLVTWSAEEAASGTYFAVLEAGQQVRTIKITLLK